MNEYTVVEVIAAVLVGQHETGHEYRVIDPLGNVVYQAQYRYMCEDRAYNFNDATKALRDNLATQALALDSQLAKIAELEAHNRRLLDVARTQQKAIEDARQALSNQTHGGAQYQPDVLEADSILANALSETESASKESQSE